ncbi:MAG: hypothetical protein EBS53_13025 [Bacteroidetes bacterium]|nr:hypothetical protein [Bacteroidota bacterium]
MAHTIGYFKNWAVLFAQAVSPESGLAIYLPRIPRTKPSAHFTQAIHPVSALGSTFTTNGYAALSS